MLGPRSCGEPAPLGAYDALLCALLFVLFGTLYALTCCPTIFWYDSAEYTAAALTLSIPHPPGYPLYTLIGKLFTLLPLEPARAMNLMSALFGAATVALLYLVVRKMRARPLAAVMGAATLGATSLLWSQSVIAEVYTPALAALAGVLLLLLSALERDDGRLALLAALLAGLGLGLHLFIATCGIGLAIWVLGLGLPIERPGQLRQLVSRAALARRLRVATGCALACGVGASIYLYIPWRAATHPVVYTRNPSSWSGFWWFVSGGLYKGWFLEDFDHLARAAKVATIFYDQLLVVGLLLAAVGTAFAVRRRPLVGIGLLAMIAGNVGFFFDYDVHDFEVFFLPSLLALCALVGIGCEAIFQALPHAGAPPRARRLARWAPLVLLSLPLSLVLTNFTKVDLSDYRAAERYGKALCRELPPGTVMLNQTTSPEWKNAAVFEMFFHKALGCRPDVQTRTRREISVERIEPLLRSGVPVYLYYPLMSVQRLFEVERAGVAYRIVRVRPRPLELGDPLHGAQAR